jgi:hypothetical protein
MGKGRQGIPKSFGLLVQVSHHPADRAWASLGAFVAGQAFLFASWGAMLNAQQAPARWVVMIALPAVGCAICALFCLLLTRMWDYHTLYDEQLRAMIKRNAGGRPEKDLTVPHRVNEEIRTNWYYEVNAEKRNALNNPWHVDLRLSLIRYGGNRWVLFLVPFLLSFVHITMIGVLLRCSIDNAKVPCTDLCFLGPSCVADTFTGVVVLYIFVMGLVLWQCLPRLCRHWKRPDWCIT